VSPKRRSEAKRTGETDADAAKIAADDVLRRIVEIIDRDFDLKEDDNKRSAKVQRLSET
jgi:hypothetical protein